MRVLPVLAVWGLAWVALLLWAVPDVPVDNAEQLTWVRSLQWGYYKHPPLPTWLISPFVQILGLHAWVAVVLGALIKIGSLALWWDLLRRLLDARRALIGLVCACAVAYYSTRLHLYSHNELMLACSVVSAWALWRAWQEGLWRFWLLLGLFLGLGLLSKYQAITTVLSTLAFCLGRFEEFNSHRRRGLGLALLTMALVLLPHAHWLLNHPHTPLVYAAQSSLSADWAVAERIRQALAWVGDLAIRSAGAFLLLAGLWWQGRRAALNGTTIPSPSTAGTDRSRQHRQARRLLAVWALVPLIMVLAMGLLGGATIRPHWATPMALWIVAAGVALLPSRAVHAMAMSSLLWSAATLQVGLVGHVLWSAHQAPSAAPRWGQPMTHRWAPAVAEAARQELKGDIRVVIAPETVATGFALAAPERPYAVVDGRLEISPWVPKGLIERCGVLFVVYEPLGPGRRPVEGGPPGLTWRVVPPVEGLGCVGNDKRLPRPSASE